jgi:hypothetical protein
MATGSLTAGAPVRPRRARRPPPLTLARRWATLLLVLAGLVVVVHGRLAGHHQASAPIPLPVPGKNGSQTGSDAGSAATPPIKEVSAPASASGDAAKAGLAAAVQASRLQPSQAAAARDVVGRSERLLAADPNASGGNAAAALAEVAAQADVYDSARVHVLFSQLAVNLDHGAAPADAPDITGADGTVYRYMAGHGYVFHPLANFGRLNRYVSRGDVARTRQLADALLARGVKQGDRTLWEYYFSFGGPSRWTSGFAQAVAADSLFRAGQLLHDARLKETAHAAFAGLAEGLTAAAGGGRWVIEYSYDTMLVLNADLESLLALNRYAKESGDARAATLAKQFDTAARNLLPSFDTGCWSRYSLNGHPASASYHAYHVQLLRRLFATTGNPLWRETAARWAGYQQNPSC